MSKRDWKVPWHAGLEDIPWVPGIIVMIIIWIVLSIIERWTQ